MHRCSLHVSDFKLSKNSIGRLICQECFGMSPDNLISPEEHSELLSQKVGKFNIQDPIMNNFENPMNFIITKTKDLFANLIRSIEDLRDKTLQQLNDLEEKYKRPVEIQNILIKRYLNDVTNLHDYTDYGKYLDNSFNFLFSI